MKNVTDTILTQYAGSPKLRGLVETFNSAMDIDAFTEEFLKAIWDVSTAEGYGLDVWGKIVNVSRFLNVEEEQTAFGFDEAYISSNANSPKPFDQAPFYEGVGLTTTFRLTDDAYRTLIMAKAMANITDCTIPNINRLLRYLFSGRGDVFVAVTGVMAIRYVFGFELTPVESAILLKSNAVTKPAGVSVDLMTVDFNNTFGFNEASLQPFEVGTFFPDSGIKNAN
ncbi:DUF2612 domain-containing protein [Pantoea sp. CCBC3-3-1]|uniref:DUF2612 domain-containing protein n=1 Tax=Pantoea sp. CCBC3-3-1 TaxID=2490851 RepID=UPI0011BDF899|nr:DUF2612 domain-containing protein [Pantoea sp. CCBC3-3-1]